MDPIYMRGLRDAKALLDEGVLSAEEYTSEKEELLRQRNKRTVLAARGEDVEDTPEAHVADGAAVTRSPETGGDNDDDDEAELSAYLSRSSPFLAGCPSPLSLVLCLSLRHFTMVSHWI